MRISSINENITRLQQRHHLIHKGIDRSTGFHHHHHLAGAFQRGNKFLHAHRSDDVLALGPTFHKIRHLGGGPVGTGHGKSLAFHIENEVFHHHGKAYNPDICFRHV